MSRYSLVKLRIPLKNIGSQTKGEKVLQSKGEEPRPFAKVPKFLLSAKEGLFVDDQKVGFEAATL